MGICPSDYVRILETSLSFELVCGKCKRYKSGHSVGWGARPNIAVIHVLEGVFWAYRGCRGKAEKTLIRPGGVFVFPSGVPHSWGLESDEGFVQESYIHATILDCIDLCDLYKLPFTLNHPESTKLGEAIGRLRHLYSNSEGKEILSMITRKKLGFTILEGLLQNAKSKCNTTKRLASQTERLHPVFKYIQQNLEGAITREALAEQINLSPSRFNALFKDCTGQSPMNYVKFAKLKRAQNLLWRTDLSVSEIADKLAFYDAFHFSKQFKRAFEISPRDFRTNTQRTTVN